jgi:hypothetical protein
MMLGICGLGPVAVPLVVAVVVGAGVDVGFLDVVVVGLVPLEPLTPTQT